MNISNRPLRVFICHAPVDQPITRDLHAQLQAAAWMDIWFIDSSLTIQDNWEEEIRRRVHQADVIIALISRNSFKPASYVYPEPNFVFSILDNRRAGGIRAIRLYDPCIETEARRLLVMIFLDSAAPWMPLHNPLPQTSSI